MAKTSEPPQAKIARPQISQELHYRVKAAAAAAGEDAEEYLEKIINSGLPPAFRKAGK